MIAVGVQREDDLAWELVDSYRECLTVEERAIAFVNLGVGEYEAVIRSVLHALSARRKTLTPTSAAKVRAWIDCYDTHAEFDMLLTQTSR